MSFQFFLLFACMIFTYYTLGDSKNKTVIVYHFVLKHWGDLLNGDMNCPDINCVWKSAEQIKILKNDLESLSGYGSIITVGLYNIHSLWEKFRQHKPNSCELQVNLSMVESEESYVRYKYLFEPSFSNFDGNVTTHPLSSVQRVYNEVFLNSSHFLPHLNNFASLIKGASYVASDCHRHDSANANRDGVVQILRDHGFRVDGLGRCMRRIGPEGISLPTNPDTRYNLQLKRETIAKFMFYLAFENSIESGYVTEKPFDALYSGYRCISLRFELFDMALNRDCSSISG
jgi:hypothetical protein